MPSEAQSLLRERTSAATAWVSADLLSLKQSNGATVAVILPALNEASTIGGIVAEIRDLLMDPKSALVDELLVLDSGSTDQTAAVAQAAGAQVVHRDDVLDHIPGVLGKGEAMWRGLAATTSDIVVFIDADLLSFDVTYVIGLLGPLLSDHSVQLVKATYSRPLRDGERVTESGGGRVTELVARPLLNLYWPALSGVMQPLAGEYAARRGLLERLPFPCGYGVEFALLVDAAELCGVKSFAQVDLGTRRHRHHDDRKLGQMSAEILQVACNRLDADGHLRRDAGLGATLWQYASGSAGALVTGHEVSALERPPLISIPEYLASRPTTTSTGSPQPT